MGERRQPGKIISGDGGAGQRVGQVFLAAEAAVAVPVPLPGGGLGGGVSAPRRAPRFRSAAAVPSRRDGLTASGAGIHGADHPTDYGETWRNLSAVERGLEPLAGDAG
jgi:hypothetical protein